MHNIPWISIRISCIIPLEHVCLHISLSPPTHTRTEPPTKKTRSATQKTAEWWACSAHQHSLRYTSVPFTDTEKRNASNSLLLCADFAWNFYSHNSSRYFPRNHSLLFSTRLNITLQSPSMLYITPPIWSRLLLLQALFCKRLKLSYVRKQLQFICPNAFDSSCAIPQVTTILLLLQPLRLAR